MKKTHQITVHLSEECADVVGALADLSNLSKSEWVCQLIENDLLRRYRQAHDAINLLAPLQNYQNDKHHQNA